MRFVFSLIAEYPQSGIDPGNAFLFIPALHEVASARCKRSSLYGTWIRKGFLMLPIRAFTKLRFVLLACSSLSLPRLVDAASIYLEAETGTIADVQLTNSTTGPGWNLVNDLEASAGTAIESVFDSANAPDGANDDIVTYDVTFPESGTYFLYARVGIPGVGGPDDEEYFRNDSFFVPSSFSNFQYPTFAEAVRALNFGNETTDKTRGTNSILDSYGWVGITQPVTNNGGGIDNSNSNVILAGSNGPDPYIVPAAGTYTFQIGGREDGLLIDALVFSTENDLTIGLLDAIVPEPSPLLLLCCGVFTCLRRSKV